MRFDLFKAPLGWLTQGMGLFKPFARRAGCHSRKAAIRALLLAFLCFSLPAAAEEPWYKVEILVFAHSSPSALKEQRWRDLKVPRRPDAIELGNGGNGAYQRLPGNNLVLTAEKNRLSEQADYRTLFHGAWYQPVSAAGSAHPVRIRGGKLMPNNAYELDGYLTLDMDDYLNVRPDLYYSFLAPDSTDSNGDKVLTVNLKTSRRVNADEIHYIDHPLFGMLVVIQR